MHADMDGCHARSQCSADTTGHGKTCFHGEKKGRPVYDVYPQKEKIDRYARSLQKLAHTFYEMPGRQEQLSQAEVQDMFVQVQQRVCMECSGRENCWSDLDPRTSQQVFELLQIIEEGNSDRLYVHRVNGLGSATRLSGLQRSCSASFLKPEKNCCIAIG